ncbi:leucyl/phenylalanyl-tRNA--protein transferase [Ruficoccus amylovorans]|uniref:Leucyl/phenylalanyl-tRNA--protein transferase n=1 Tax=Ruficoccus amylovorans TaxID=1804625 RepID=A0A842HCQ2_9BACT|nr:leucyl/phenylalanyl-tRNA--protein transferase [Ruficoccus amylovorans]MBC2594275.1 leucyl/phenylalanyl-tRNA--protein transferase [Ruficoccus amylovorans]
MQPRFTNAFPDPHDAPADAPLAVGGDLSIIRLIEAYSRGIFPWYNAGEPILWWSPDPRFVLLPRELKVSHSLRKELKKDCWEVTFDQAFGRVIRACAHTPRPGQDGTWIVEDIITAYLELHAAGFAHSVECWLEGKLVGGLYGVSLGAAFFGESMFHHAPNASKVAFVRLVERLRQWEFQLIDCQQPTRYLASFGATCWPRETFLRTLSNAVTAPTRIGKW